MVVLFNVYYLQQASGLALHFSLPQLASFLQAPSLQHGFWCEHSFFFSQSLQSPFMSLHSPFISLQSAFLMSPFARNFCFYLRAFGSFQYLYFCLRGIFSDFFSFSRSIVNTCKSKSYYTHQCNKFLHVIQNF